MNYNHINPPPPQHQHHHLLAGHNHHSAKYRDIAETNTTTTTMNTNTMMMKTRTTPNYLCYEDFIHSMKVDHSDEDDDDDDHSLSSAEDRRRDDALGRVPYENVPGVEPLFLEPNPIESMKIYYYEDSIMDHLRRFCAPIALIAVTAIIMVLALDIGGRRGDNTNNDVTDPNPELPSSDDTITLFTQFQCLYNATAGWYETTEITAEDSWFLDTLYATPGPCTEEWCNRQCRTSNTTIPLNGCLYDYIFTPRQEDDNNTILRYETCQCRQVTSRRNGYMCRARDSICNDVTNRCECLPNFIGNPFIPSGCYHDMNATNVTTNSSSATIAPTAENITNTLPPTSSDDSDSNGDDNTITRSYEQCVYNSTTNIYRTMIITANDTLVTNTTTNTTNITTIESGPCTEDMCNKICRTSNQTIPLNGCLYDYVFNPRSDWYGVIWYETCQCIHVTSRRQSWKCRAQNSLCNETTNQCECLTNYTGNPLISNGCYPIVETNVSQTLNDTIISTPTNPPNVTTATIPPASSNADDNNTTSSSSQEQCVYKNATNQYETTTITDSTMIIVTASGPCTEDICNHQCRTSNQTIPLNGCLYDYIYTPRGVMNHDGIILNYETCQCLQVSSRRQSWKCRAQYSLCNDITNQCECLPNYIGNPLLTDGCIFVGGNNDTTTTTTTTTTNP